MVYTCLASRITVFIYFLNVISVISVPLASSSLKQVSLNLHFLPLVKLTDSPTSKLAPLVESVTMCQSG